MNTEYEVKILQIPVEAFIQKLNKLGAKKVGEQFFKRYVYDLESPDHHETWIRLRTDGRKTTITVKEIHDHTVEGTKELEIDVSDFEKTYQLLSALGFNAKAYQENKRVQYILDGVEIDIDSWPLIPSYAEIEGHSKKEVEHIVKKLGYTMKDTTALNTIYIYQKYGIDSEKIKKLVF